MLDDELAEVIRDLRALDADDADVEAKRAADRLPRSVRETLAAFANTRGGTLILGLDESAGFRATGVAEPAKMCADLAAVSSDEMEPPLRPIIKTHRFEGVDLVVAEVPALDPVRRPCYYRGAGITQGSFVRVGDGDRRLTSYEVHLMLANRGQPRDDEEVVPGTSVENLDDDLVDRFVRRLRDRREHAFAGLDPETILRRSKVLVDGQLTLGGLMALGEFPQEFFPQLMVSFVHYPTTHGADVATGERFIDNVVAEGPIPVMVRDAMRALRRNMKRRATVQGIGRIDTWEYPEPALREAIVNALVHRDYSPRSRGAQVQIEMYPDRLVVRNPGGLYGSVTEETLGLEGSTSTRNATLLRMLEDVVEPDTDRPVCENRGSGIHTMLAALRAASMQPPQFADKISVFRVTFPNHALISAEVVEWLQTLGQRDLTDSQCLGLAMLKSGQGLDNKSYRSANGIDSRVATAELGDLVNRGLVVQVGGRRWARYELAHDVGDSAAGGGPRAGRRRADRRDEILDALGDRELSRAELTAVTGLGEKVLQRWLRRLREEGRVEPVGANIRSPNVRYRRASGAAPGDAE